MLSKDQAHQKRIHRWNLEYSDGCYCIIDPDGARAQKTLPVLPIGQIGQWKAVRHGKYYRAADQNGNALPDSCILKDYQIVELLSFGGSSLCYKAVNKNTGHIQVVKELYPYVLAKEGLIYRDGTEIREKPDLDPKAHERVKNTFERGFLLEQEANDSVRFYQEETGTTNDPRFLSSSPVAFEGHPKALNRYQVIDTQAGTFLDKVIFESDGRERVIDVLSLIKQLLISIRVLHKEKKRVHLDLKSENLLVSRAHVNNEKQWGNHPVILIDFGSSVPVDDDGRIIIGNEGINLTSTMSYAAPEVENAALDEDYSTIGVWSDIFSVFIIAQHLLLSDADIADADDLSCESIRESRSAVKLSEDEQQLLIGFLRSGLDTRKIDTADKAIEELDILIEVLNDHGIHPILIQKNARRIAAQIREKDRIDPALLCEVELVNK